MSRGAREGRGSCCLRCRDAGGTQLLVVLLLLCAASCCGTCQATRRPAVVSLPSCDLQVRSRHLHLEMGIVRREGGGAKAVPPRLHVSGWRRGCSRSMGPVLGCGPWPANPGDIPESGAPSPFPTCEYMYCGSVIASTAYCTVQYSTAVCRLGSGILLFPEHLCTGAHWLFQKTPPCTGHRKAPIQPSGCLMGGTSQASSKTRAACMCPALPSPAQQAQPSPLSVCKSEGPPQSARYPKGTQARSTCLSPTRLQQPNQYAVSVRPAETRSFWRPSL